MCGIAGIISTESGRLMVPMLQSIAHRGRDDEGVWSSSAIDDFGRTACLGHRRLAIIDTSPAGHEPMHSADGRYVITFNGEIYNFRELRDQLRALGHYFKTDTDTEVLLTAFSRWGDSCLTRLNGMFAFAIWDTAERSLTLARDHVGIKPLYYSHVSVQAGSPGNFIFASEIKAILATKQVSAELNAEALHQFLTFLWTPDPNTLFAGIHTVPPGYLLKLRDNKLELKQWWDVSFEEIDESKDEAWWQEQVLETLDKVVRREMVSDVPLGAFLSGGLDSSGIVAMMQRHSNGRRVDTYTAGIESTDLRYDIIPDDVRWARRVNEQLQTDYREITLKPQLADLLPKLVHHMEEPPIDMAIPSYLISRAARESLTVML